MPSPARRVLPVLCLLLAACPVGGRGAPAAAPGTPPVRLRVATWECYVDPQRRDKPRGWQAFEGEGKAVLEAVVFPTNDEILRAMRTGRFDLCVASCDIVPALIAEGLVRPLPVARLPHYRDLLPELKHVRYGAANGHDYCAPFAWGELGLAYDTSVFAQPPGSWRVLWDPAWRGRVAHWDDISVLWTAALANGRRDVFSLQGQPLWEAARWAARLVGSGAVLWRADREGDPVAAMAAGRVVLNVTWPSAVAATNRDQARKSGRWAMAWPAEGVTGYIDNACISATTAQPALANAFVDVMLSPEVQTAMSDALDFAPTSAVAVAGLTPARRGELHLEDPNRVNRFYLWQAIANRAEYERLWGEARAGRLVQ